LNGSGGKRFYFERATELQSPFSGEYENDLILMSRKRDCCVEGLDRDMEKIIGYIITIYKLILKLK